MYGEILLVERFTVGIVGAPFGVKGFVKVRSFSGETGHLEGLKELCLRQNEKEKVYTLEEISSGGEKRGSLLLKFAGIDSPEAAKALSGAEVIADRAHAVPLKEGEYYIEDLKGLQVVVKVLPTVPNEGSEPENCEVLGSITDILEGGGGELAEIRLNSGEIKLVPFRKEFFGDIDVQAGRAVLLERWILE